MTPLNVRNLHCLLCVKKPATVKGRSKTETVEVNRNVLSKLLAYSAETTKPINIKEALSYPLSPVSLSLAHPDGTRRSTGKSALADILIKYCDSPTDPSKFIYDKKNISAYIFDLMALINTLTSIPTTYRDLSFKILNLLPIGYHRIDIVADTYIKNSLKASERDKRGIANPVLIQSGSSKVPRKRLFEKDRIRLD